MGALFSLVDMDIVSNVDRENINNGAVGGNVRDEDRSEEGNGDSSDDGTETRDVDSVERRNRSADWIEMRNGNFLSIEYQLESILEVITFVLLEPLTLGFFPYVSNCGEVESTAGTSSAPKSNSDNSTAAESTTGTLSAASSVAASTHDATRTEQRSEDTITNTG